MNAIMRITHECLTNDKSYRHSRQLETIKLRNGNYKNNILYFVHTLEVYSSYIFRLDVIHD